MGASTPGDSNPGDRAAGNAGSVAGAGAFRRGTLIVMTTELPVGTVTFMFTDIERSTELAQRLGADFPQLVADHFELIRSQIAVEGGSEVKTLGDGVFAVFPGAAPALRAAAGIQREISAFAWPDGGDVRLRVGLHTGEATMSEDDYVGIEVHRAARIMAAGHGGQVLISEATRVLAGGSFSYMTLGRHALRGLEEDEALYQLVVDGLPSDFPPIRTATAIPNNLPVRASSILGRDADVDVLIGLVAEHRIVSVLGPGGIGKTSLAVTVGGRVLDRFSGGVRFVDLSAVSEPAFVVTAIADEIGADPKSMDGVTLRLGNSPTLLILDNFEHVVEAAADVGQLIDACAGLKLLVTTQAPLHLPGEQRYSLQPLETEPSADSPGVRLFSERARAVDPSFSSDPEEVAALVRMLDGLPLAIELTAAMANLLTPSDMIKRLSAGRSASRASTTGPERHRSLNDALEWSHGLLDTQAQLVFRRLSVFADGMSLSAAEEVAGASDVDPLTTIAELVDRSLLLRRAGSTSRLHMLEGIRRFGRDRLAESNDEEPTVASYADHFCHLAHDAHDGLQSDRGEWWRARIDDELGNFRDVLSHLWRAGEAARGLELLGNIWRFHQSRGRLIELRLWLDRFFELADADEATLGRAKGLMARAAASYWRGESDAAIGDYEEAVKISRGLDDEGVVADALYGLGASLIISGRPERAEPLLDEAKALYSSRGDLGGLADIVAGEAFIALRQHGLSGLGPAFERAAALYTEAGRQVQATQCLLAQSAVAIIEGRLEDALGFAKSAIQRGVELVDIFVQTWGLEYVARIALEFGQIETAAMLAGAAHASAEQMGGGWDPGVVGLDTARDLLVERFGQGEAASRMKSGESTTLEDTVELALSIEPPSPSDGRAISIQSTST